MIIVKKSRQVLVLYFTKNKKIEIRSPMGPHVSYRCLVFNHEL